jgi:hypothetical protein
MEVEENELRRISLERDEFLVKLYLLAVLCTQPLRRPSAKTLETGLAPAAIQISRDEASATRERWAIAAERNHTPPKHISERGELLEHGAGGSHACRLVAMETARDHDRRTAGATLNGPETTRDLAHGTITSNRRAAFTLDEHLGFRVETRTLVSDVHRARVGRS